MEPMPRGIEGGDVLVLTRDTILVGLSQRTTEQAIETLAQRLLIERPVLKEILVMQIPIARAYMHLDTVFTMVDYDKFLFFPGIRDMVYMPPHQRQGQHRPCRAAGLNKRRAGTGPGAQRANYLFGRFHQF